MGAGGLVTALAARHLARRRVLAGVAVVGLACGVAAVTATRLLHASVVAAYDATMRRFAGRAALEVTNGESGVPEELADELRGVPGVRAVVAAVEGFVATPDLPGERLYLYGVDLLADQEVRDYGAGAAAAVSDPVVFLAAPDSVALTEAFLRAHGLAMQDRVRVRTPAGVVTLVVRAVLAAPDGPASALDGRLAVVDLSVAQELLRFDRRVSQLAIELAPGVDAAAMAPQLAARVGARGTVEPPRARAATFARLLTNYRNGLLLAAAVAMIVAVHFVANLAAVTVEERRHEMALLRLVGASARLVATIVAVETMLAALAATVVGVPLGVVLARALHARFDAGVAALYGDVGDAPLGVDVAAVAASAGVGLGVPLLAVAGALRRAHAVGPLAALRPPVTAAPGRAAWGGARVGMALVLLAVAVWAAREYLPVALETAGATAMLGALAGIAAAVPDLVRALATAADGWARRVGRVVPLLAARQVVAERRRAAATCGALLVGLAGTIAVATWIASLDATLHEAFDAVFARIDLVVSGGADPFARDAVRMPGDVVGDLAGVPEVAFADALRVDTIAYRGSRAAIVARDAASYVEGRRRLSMVEGDAGAAARALVAGTGVVVNRAFAHRFGYRPGDLLELATPEGMLRVRIAGIHLELTPGDLGAIQLDRRTYRRWWRDDSVTQVEVALRPAGDRAPVADAIRARWGERYGVAVLTVDELRRGYRAMLGRLTALVRPLLALALGCALVGVASAGAAAMLVRRRTHAVLRAIGLTRRQLACITGLELATTGAIAGGAAMGIGWVLGWLQVEVLLRGMLGLSVRFACPHDLACGAAVAVVAAMGAAGWWLGSRAGRGPLAEALRWE